MRIFHHDNDLKHKGLAHKNLFQVSVIVQCEFLEYFTFCLFQLKFTCDKHYIPHLFRWINL